MGDLQTGRGTTLNRGGEGDSIDQRKAKTCWDECPKKNRWKRKSINQNDCDHYAEIDVERQRRGAF